MGAIVVTTEELRNAAEKIDSFAGEYMKSYMSLYGDIENMKEAWDGEDNMAYVNQVQGFQEDFQIMYNLMLEYSQFLKNSAQAYENTQSDIISQASKLAN